MYIYEYYETLYTNFVGDQGHLYHLYKFCSRPMPFIQFIPILLETKTIYTIYTNFAGDQGHLYHLY